MQGSKIPVRTWGMAFYLLPSARNGMSWHESKSILQINHELAWFMSHRIGYAFAPTSLPEAMSGTVEADETYVGGKLKKGTQKGNMGR